MWPEGGHPGVLMRVLGAGRGKETEAKERVPGVGRGKGTEAEGRVGVGRGEHVGAKGHACGGGGGKGNPMGLLTQEEEWAGKGL
jgi:hypothetical protein